MDTLELLKEFCSVNSKYKRLGTIIERQNPVQYESEYGAPLADWTDEILMDLFIYKLGFYKMSSLENRLVAYSEFYRYCAEAGYIRRNPFYKSKYLSYSYLVSEIAESGNVPFYTREYLMDKCLEQDSSAYFVALVFSIYEGIRSCPELEKIKYKDVDFENKTFKLDGYNQLILSDELLAAYKRHYLEEVFVYGDRQKFFDDTQGLLIKPVKIGNKPASSNNLPKKFMNLGLKIPGVYDSGLITRVIRVIGKDALIQYLISDGMDKWQKVMNNRQMEEVLKQCGYNRLPKYFVYDYKVYGYCLKYGLNK